MWGANSQASAGPQDSMVGIGSAGLGSSVGRENFLRIERLVEVLRMMMLVLLIYLHTLRMGDDLMIDYRILGLNPKQKLCAR